MNKVPDTLDTSDSDSDCNDDFDGLTHDQGHDVEPVPIRRSVPIPLRRSTRDRGPPDRLSYHTMGTPSNAVAQLLDAVATLTSNY
jgi:hypothetical protein